MTRATLLVIAPSVPVAWSPGAAPLSDSLRARVLAGAGAAVERAVTVMPTSGRRVVSVPIEAAMRRMAAPERLTRPMAELAVVPVPIAPEADGRPAAASPGRASVGGPWPAPEPVAGVIVRTSPVPVRWLRPSSAPVVTSHAAAPVGGTAQRPAPARRVEAPVSTSVRVRRAAVMAIGLLVSLVAVEAAARAGRR